MKYLSDEEFIMLFQMYKSPSIMAAELGVSERSIYARRNALEARYQIQLETVEVKNRIDPKPPQIDLGILNGTVIVFSDAHFWPGIRTTAYDGLIWAIKNLENVKAVINNGDAFDGASISRFPRIGWDKRLVSLMKSGPAKSL